MFAPLFARVCEVVHSAHELGIVHRDIEDANVMVIERAYHTLARTQLARAHEQPVPPLTCRWLAVLALAGLPETNEAEPPRAGSPRYSS